MRLGPPIAAATTIAEMPMQEDNSTKTVLSYQAPDSYEIRRHFRRGNRTQSFKITPAELQGLILHWPEWRDWLLSVGVDNVAPVMPFQSPPTASQEPSSSPSSTTQGSLL